MYLYLAVLQVLELKSLVYYELLFFKKTAALVLALKIRNVNIKVVNDSKEIVAMVYFTTIAVMESLILTLVLPGNHVSLVLSSGHLVLAASAVVGLTFIPKVWCSNFHLAWEKNQVHNAFHCRWYLFGKIQRERKCLLPMILQ